MQTFVKKDYSPVAHNRHRNNKKVLFAVVILV